MELNALTRWESIGKDLYERGVLGHEIAILKRRSKQVDRQRAERQQQRSEVEETIDSTATTNASPSPTSSSSDSSSTATSKWNSRTQLDQLEQEEAMLTKFRQLRDGGKVLQKEEEKLEQSVFTSSGLILESFPAEHQRWVYFSYRIARRFFKGFAFGYFGKFTFAFIGLVLRHKLNLSKLLPDLVKLMIKPELLKYGGFLGSFLMLFESVMRLLRMKNYLSQNHRSVRVIASACVASAVSITFLPKDARLGISMFFLVRALEVLVRWATEEKEKAYTTRQHRRGGSALGEEWTTGASENEVSSINHASGGTQLMLPTTSNTAVMNDLARESGTVNNTSANANAFSQLSNTGGLSITLADASTFASPECSPFASTLTSPTHQSGSILTLNTSSSTQSQSFLTRIGSRLKHSLVRISKLPISYHFDTLIMGLASSQVLWAWIFNRSTIDSSYLHFLDVQGGKGACVRNSFAALLAQEHTIPPALLTQLNALRITEGSGPLDLSLPLPSMICSVLHQDHSCIAGFWHFLRGAYLRALPVYLPIYVIPMLIFKHRQLLKHPLKVLLPTLTNLARSSLFLSSYCSVAWSAACPVSHHFLGAVSHTNVAFMGFFAGLTVGIEQKGRRTEIALYVLSKALPSFIQTLQQTRMLPKFPQGDAVCFVAAMAVIMWSYVTRPHLLRSSYLSLFKFFFGSGGRSAGFSSRAVEHSTPRAMLHQSIREMGPPILSLDVEVEKSENGLKEDRNLTGICFDHLRPRPIPS